MAVELWMVVAVIQEFKLDVVTRALERLPGFTSMTVSDCRGFGRERNALEFTPKVRVEIAVAGRERADVVAAVIAGSAHTGKPGDGRVFILPMTRAIRIRTFGVDEDAL